MLIFENTESLSYLVESNCSYIHVHTHVSRNFIGFKHKKFRQINSLVFSLVKTLLSRNFCQRSHTATADPRKVYFKVVTEPKETYQFQKVYYFPD